MEVTKHHVMQSVDVMRWTLLFTERDKQVAEVSTKSYSFSNHSISDFRCLVYNKIKVDFVLTGFGKMFHSHIFSV